MTIAPSGKRIKYPVSEFALADADDGPDGGCCCCEGGYELPELPESAGEGRLRCHDADGVMAAPVDASNCKVGAVAPGIGGWYGGIIIGGAGGDCMPP